MLISLASGHVAIVDDADYEAVLTCELRNGEIFSGRICDRHWHVEVCGTRGTYARSLLKKHSMGKTTQYLRLHRLVIGAPFSQWVDHENGNGLDCRRENIRLCTPQQNASNRRLRSDSQTGFKGVSRKGKGFEARIRVQGRLLHLGCFATDVDAARAYDVAALHYQGAFARLNFPLVSAAS